MITARIIHRAALGASMFALICCAAQPSGPAHRAAPSAPAIPDGLHWFRDSAEQKLAYEEIYRAAAAAARERSKSLPSEAWGVILDIDETVLDNSEYQKRLAIAGQQYNSKTWNGWVSEKSATALPGAKWFVDTVLDDLKGQIILITNRTEAQCPDTEENLHHESIRYTRILCDSTGTADKNDRFRAVQMGSQGHPPLNVLVWIGTIFRTFPH